MSKDTKRTYQVIFDYIANGNYTEYTRDRRIVDAESPQAAVDLVKANRGDLVGYEACNVLEIAEGWCVRQGKVVKQVKHYCVDYMADPTFYDNDYEYGCRTVDAESAQEAVDILMKDPPRRLGFTVLGVQQVVGTRMRVIDGKVVSK